MRKNLANLVIGMVGAVIVVSACQPQPVHSQARGAMQSAEANPTVQADQKQAAALVAASLQGGSYSAARACLEGKVPPANRKALVTCLGSAYAADVQGTGHLTAAYVTLKTSDVPGKGAQPCVATALK